MQIIQLLDKFCFGGGERVALTYQHTFNSLKLDNLIVALDGGRDSCPAGLKVVRNYLAYFSIIFDQLKTKPGEATYLIAHTNRALLIGWIFKVFYRKKIKLMYVQHLFYSPLKVKLLSYCQYWIDSYIQITPITTQLMKRYFASEKCFYLNNYLALQTYLSVTNSNDVLNDFLAVKGERQVITFLGRITQGKNADHLLKLLKLLPSDRYIGLILGTGDELEHIQDLAKDLKIENLYIAGFQEQPLAFLQISDYMFFSSTYKAEMMPMAVLEAKTLGCKVIAYQLEVNSHILPESNIFVYQDFAAIAQGILDNSIVKDKNIYDEEYGALRFKQLFGA
tara:strand:- start:1422 stop:2429 length:1008 start_codon:yes stop_codon:yes gene_type:complete